MDKLEDDSPMPFGKHKGELLEDVPASYLLWLLTTDWINQWPQLRNYIKYVETQLHEEVGDDWQNPEDDT